MDASTLTWAVARAAGMMAFVLSSASVLAGIALSLKWRSATWPRFVTNEVHRFITLVSLVFIALHGVAVLIDPFIGFTPVEVLVPLAIHYRPLWVALGVVAGYLLLALWISEWLRPRIGYAAWRAFHSLAFAAWGLGLVHGIATGTDTRTWWGLGLYGTSVALVVALLAVRLLPSDPRRPSHPVAAGIGALILAEVILWTVLGPLQPGWNAIANNGNGSGQAGTAVSSPANGTPSP